jgi:hypothetical protein
MQGWQFDILILGREQRFRLFKNGTSKRNLDLRETREKRGANEEGMESAYVLET